MWIPSSWSTGWGGHRPSRSPEETGWQIFSLSWASAMLMGVESPGNFHSVLGWGASPCPPGLGIKGTAVKLVVSTSDWWHSSWEGPFGGRKENVTLVSFGSWGANFSLEEDTWCWADTALGASPSLCVPLTAVAWTYVPLQRAGKTHLTHRCVQTPSSWVPSLSTQCPMPTSVVPSHCSPVFLLWALTISFHRLFCLIEDYLNPWLPTYCLKKKILFYYIMYKHWKFQKITSWIQFLAFYYVDPRDWLQIVKLSGRCPYPLSDLTSIS